LLWANREIPGSDRFAGGWANGDGDDCEGDEHDGREPQEDDEDGGDKESAFGWSDEEAARGKYPSLMGARSEHEGDL
jgi:hypothetical protein